MKRNWFKVAIAIFLALCLCFSLTACRKVVVTDSSYYSDYGSDLPYNDDTSSVDDSSDAANSNTSGNTNKNNSSGGSTTTVGNKNNTNNNNTPTQQPSGGGIGSDTGKKLADDKVVDMKGYNFTILSAHLPTKLSKNSTLFEENLFARIKEVEQTYNCKITILNSPYPDMETIQTYIAAGKKVADLLELSPYQMVAAK